FFVGCLLGDEYEPDNEYLSLIGLTPYGSEFEAATQANNPDLTAAEIRLAIFGVFGLDMPLVDVESSDVAAVHRTFSSEITNGKIRFPWIYGRLLHDRYFELWGGQRQSLGAADSRALLDGTPQGVFQLGELVVGPLGLLRS